MSENNKTVGSEIIRVDFSKNDEVTAMKEQFAKVYDSLVSLVVDAQNAANATPAIHSAETITTHMEVVRISEETMRCMSEACKHLEIAAMFAVKGMTS